MVASVIWDRKYLYEIAEELGMSIRNVGRIRDRGFELLRQTLDEDGTGTSAPVGA